ncbi:MAG: hypothetical protein ACI4EK_08585 [Wujia sp.]
MMNTHPLDCLVKDDSLFILEALIPFVDYAYKKPLILLIKYLETKAILDCFDHPDYIFEHGFDCHPQNSQEFIRDMCRFLPGGYADNIRNMQKTMQMMQAMQNLQGFDSFKPEANSSNKEAPHQAPPPCHLYEDVMSILNEES